MENITRRKFFSKSLALGAGLGALSLIRPSKTEGNYRPRKNDISLAQWSLVREFRQGKWKTIDFPKICKEDFGINGIEFVNTFFEVPTNDYLRRLKKNASSFGVQLVLIMVDSEGEMAAPTKEERIQTVINHRKWIDIANFLGCHSIRTNCRGPEKASREDMLNWAEESFNMILEYAGQAGIGVIIENHGGISSDPDFLVELMKRVNDPNFGVLPDFGNFPDNIDRYEAVRKLVPYAKGISVKTTFNAQGPQILPGYDTEKLIKICQEEGYTGFYGIEAEGQESDSWTQVRQLKKIVEHALWGK